MSKLWPILFCAAISLGAIGDAFYNTINVTTYNRSFFVDAGSLTQGAGTPTARDVGTTYKGLGLDNNNETLFFDWHVPNAWDASSDITISIHWSNEPGTAIADTETVIFDCDWQSIAEGEDFGAAATNATATYTQSGAGTDGESFLTVVTVDYDDVTNPLVKGDLVGVECFRDFTADTYAADAVVLSFLVTYQSTSIGSL